MVLENKFYVPTLAIRASEMNGLEFLPGASKDRMTPCFLLAPWANSSSLDRTITRIQRAFHNRPYFLDIDCDYQCSNDASPAQIELMQLRNPANAYSNWVSFIAQSNWIWPCIQTKGLSEPQIRYQIEAVQNLGRPYCMRIVHGHFPENFADIVSAFAAGGAADFAIILEGGWTPNPLTLAAWFSGLLAGGLQAIDATVPVVLSCTSMPKGFTDFSGDEPQEVAFSNRQLVAQVSQGSNRTRVIYGDWGSTRPRELAGFANRPLDRVDYPSGQAWYISRNKEAGWDFRDAAIAVVESDEWDGNLGIWGEEMIQNTIINKELGIDTPQKNVAARVNIHLHRQAFSGQPPIDSAGFDEEWQD